MWNNGLLAALLTPSTGQRSSQEGTDGCLVCKGEKVTLLFRNDLERKKVLNYVSFSKKTYNRGILVVHLAIFTSQPGPFFFRLKRMAVIVLDS